MDGMRFVAVADLTASSSRARARSTRTASPRGCARRSSVWPPTSRSPTSTTTRVIWASWCCAGEGGPFLRSFVAGVRGRGIGSLCGPPVRALPRAPRIVLDVEDPDEPGIEDAERTDRNRRVGFYGRLGVELLPVLGYHPPHDGEEPPLRLMLWSRSPGEVDVREVVIAVYRDRYGLPATDPTVLATLQSSGRRSPGEAGEDEGARLERRRRDAPATPDPETRSRLLLRRGPVNQGVSAAHYCRAVDADVIVVGAGLAGLRCARRCRRPGATCWCWRPPTRSAAGSAPTGSTGSWSTGASSCSTPPTRPYAAGSTSTRSGCSPSAPGSRP